MSVTVRIPSLRSLGLVFTGVLLGAVLVAPVLARGTPTSGAIEPAATQTRTVSCMGRAFHPDHSSAATTFELSGPARSGEGIFSCDPGLPNKATVTRVRFTLFDSTATGEAFCHLIRGALAASNDPDEQVMAQVAATGVADTPGGVRRGDTSIAFATVDNTMWSYLLSCNLSEATGALSIVGASVNYTISATNG